MLCNSAAPICLQHINSVVLHCPPWFSSLLRCYLLKPSKADNSQILSKVPNFYAHKLVLSQAQSSQAQQNDWAPKAAPAAQTWQPTAQNNWQAPSGQAASQSSNTQQQQPQQPQQSGNTNMPPQPPQLPASESPLLYHRLEWRMLQMTSMMTGPQDYCTKSNNRIARCVRTRRVDTASQGPEAPDPFDQ